MNHEENPLTIKNTILEENKGVTETDRTLYIPSVIRRNPDNSGELIFGTLVYFAMKLLVIS